MEDDWEAAGTTTHQDHVIAHVLDATSLGYFIIEDAVHLLLDIGFIWKIYIDGEMGLLPHPVAVAELEVDEDALAELKVDIDVLLRDGTRATLARFSPLNLHSPITNVEMFSRGGERKILLHTEMGIVEIQTSSVHGVIRVREAMSPK